MLWVLGQIVGAIPVVVDEGVCVQTSLRLVCGGYWPHDAKSQAFTPYQDRFIAAGGMPGGVLA